MRPQAENSLESYNYHSNSSIFNLRLKTIHLLDTSNIYIYIYVSIDRLFSYTKYHNLFNKLSVCQSGYYKNTVTSNTE